MNQDFELKELGQIKYFNCRELDNTDLVITAFTTRTGGVSRTPFNDLNLSYNVGDEENRVAENRKIIFDALGIDYRAAVTAQQVHKDRIVLVRKEDKGKGALKYSKGIAQTDALITNIPGIPLLMCYADCVPIFILDPVKKAIALIHSGRKGTELELTLKTLFKMKKIFKTDPRSCLAAIFPSIGPCCYNIEEKNKIDDYWLNKEKYNRVKKLISEAGLDALLVKLPENVLYFSNWWPITGWGAALIPAEGEPVLITPDSESLFAKNRIIIPAEI